MARQDCPALDPTLIRHPVALELETVVQDAHGRVRVRWRDERAGALHELPLAPLFAWQLAIALVTLLTGVRRC